MTIRQLPNNPSLTSLKYQAKQMLRSQKARDPAACEVLRLHARFHGMTDGDLFASPVSLMDVQHALALSYGFAEWTALKAHVLATPTACEFSPEEVRTRLHRMFRGGPLRALPRRQRDRRMFLALAASRLTDAASDEEDVNRRLKSWLAPIAAQHALDHVQVRRALIDYGFLHRTLGGVSYWPDRATIVLVLGEAPQSDEPARILDSIEADREVRKRVWQKRDA